MSDFFCFFRKGLSLSMGARLSILHIKALSMRAELLTFKAELLVFKAELLVFRAKLLLSEAELPFR